MTLYSGGDASEHATDTQVEVIGGNPDREKTVILDDGVAELWTLKDEP